MGFYILFYFSSFGALAAFWKMEAKHYYENKQFTSFRPQSRYYLRNGQFWQYVGLVAAILFGIFMIIVQSLTISCMTELPILQVLYGQCTQDTKAISYVDLGPLSVFLILGLITTFTLVTMLLIHLLRKQSNFIALILEKSKAVFIPIFMLGALLLFLKAAFDIFPSLMWNRVCVLFWGFLLLNIGYLLTFEGMTYPEYTNTKLWKQLPYIRKTWYDFLFDSTKNIGIKQLIDVMSSDGDVNNAHASTTGSSSVSVQVQHLQNVPIAEPSNTPLQPPNVQGASITVISDKQIKPEATT